MKLRFQTKLMWAFFLAITFVSVAVIQLTSLRVKRSYERQFLQKFNNQVDYLISARDRRLESQMATGKKLARTDYIVSLLKRGKSGSTAQKKQFFETLEDSFAMKPPPGKSPPPNPNPPGGGSGNRPNFTSMLIQRMGGMLAVMDLDGEIEHLSPSGDRKQGKSRNRRIGVIEELEKMNQSDGQQITYLPQKISNGDTIIRQIVVTPVEDPESGELLGAFLMGLSIMETGAERIIDRYNHEVGNEHFDNSIFVDGEIYPSGILGGMGKVKVEDIDFGELKEAVSNELTAKAGNNAYGSFEADLHGVPHLVHYCSLNRGTPLSQAWQISAFPMEQLKKDIRDLQLLGIGIALFGGFIGLLISWLFARNLAVPIRELSNGTRQISEGNLDIILPLRSKDEIGDLTDSFNSMTSELRQKERYRDLLEKVSDASVARAMIEGTLNPVLGGELKEVTVLFCDIRGFTELTELAPPGEVIDMLNEHMTALASVVRKHNGVVDKFVGDEIMAVFGGLTTHENDAANAARCALEMVAERERLNQKNGTSIQIGIGIATGEIVAGCMGSSDRLNYTVLGARVNLGARLCGRAAPGEVVIDDQTFARIADLNPRTEPLEGLILKGFRNTVPAWKLQLN